MHAAVGNAISFLVLGVSVAACGTNSRGALDALPPSVQIIEPEGNLEIESGTTVRLRGRGVAHGTELASLDWQLGDGRRASGEGPNDFVFSNPGVYDITLSAIDANGAQSAIDGRVIRVGAIPDENFALQFFGNALSDSGRVKIMIDDPSDSTAGPDMDVGLDFTIEFWLLARAEDNRKPRTKCGEGIAWINGNIILDRDRYAQPRKYGVSLLGGHLAFGVSSATGDLTICSRSVVTTGSWHHVALTRTRAGEMAIFIDGRKDAIGKGAGGDVSYPDDGVPENHCGGPCVRSDPFLVIGAEKHDVGPEYPGFVGLIDELRISSIVRYRDRFTPPASRFVADAATAALYHFDEGVGRVVADSAQGRRPANGIINVGGITEGPRWIKSTAPSGR